MLEDYVAQLKNTQGHQFLFNRICNCDLVSLIDSINSCYLHIVSHSHSKTMPPMLLVLSGLQGQNPNVKPQKKSAGCLQAVMKF